MRVRERLTYSNVAATLALVVALGTGGAYAAEQFGSGDIRNDSLRSVDLKDRRGVKGRDARRNAFGAREVAEEDLRASRFTPTAGEISGSCAPPQGSFLTCVDASIRLRRRSDVLILATGDYSGAVGTPALNCLIAVDGANDTSSGGSPSGTGEFGFAYTLERRSLARGVHSFGLRCERVGGDAASLSRASIAVLGINR